MRRRLIQLGLFLLLGAIVNVAVAWGCAWVNAGSWTLTGVLPHSSPAAVVSPVNGASRVLASREEENSWWEDHYQIRLYARDLFVDAFAASRFGIEGRTTHCYGQRGYNMELVGTSIAVMCGWPCRVLCGGQACITIPGAQACREEGIVVFGRAGRDMILPLLPIWPGFAINTLFYAGILWLLFAVPFALRRRRRIKRGLCPACAYPVGASDVCTECGKRVAPKAMAV